MKDYVGALPESCARCKFIRPDGYNSHCNLTNEICNNLFERNEDCPLEMKYYTQPAKQTDSENK